MTNIDLSKRNDQSARIDIQLKADSGYQSEIVGARISADQWAIINKVVFSPDGLSRRLLDAIYNEHVGDAK
ncbi:MAG: hypothetical protein HY849_00400 [Nitrosomonadales bacterium]|nr:hypothetical protein [Nitrosomonadales bacterium]